MLSDDSFEFFEGRRGWTIRLKGKRNRDHHGHVDTEKHCKAIIRDILDGFLPDDEEDVECCRRILDTCEFEKLIPHPHVPHRKDKYKNTYCKRCRR